MNTYKRHRFPPDIIAYAVWLYYRFNLSHRDIEDLLAERGITVTRESFAYGTQSTRCAHGAGSASSSEPFTPGGYSAIIVDTATPSISMKSS